MPDPIVPTVTKLEQVVILDCVPLVTVAAVPDAFPVTLPVSGPAKPVAVITAVDGLYVGPSVPSTSIPWAPEVPSVKTI